ncbi:MAG: hypothetical protein HZA54_09725, partial [Planctomycetes bacterium]|nr:hypothetical protein [Planctomycetota bacterium]
MSGREGAPGSAAPRAASDRARSLGQVILLLAALFGAYANALRAEFVYDDIAVVRDNPRIRDLRNIPHFFTTSYWAASGSLDAPVASGLYRPLVQTSFALEYALWGGRPSGFHLTNVALPAAFTLLLGSGLAALRLAPGLPVLAALLFGLHPVHTEAVTSVVGRAEILC